MNHPLYVNVVYSETGIQKNCPTKPSPAQLKLSVGPFGFCVNPLRHYIASGTLCITLAASAWMTQSLWPLRGLNWLLLSLSISQSIFTTYQTPLLILYQITINRLISRGVRYKRLIWIVSCPMQYLINRTSPSMVPIVFISLIG